MSRPPMFATPTVAGIVEKDGQRVVQGTRRPDGTYRKELKIRPGFTPEEDVSRYRTTRAAEQLAREAVKGRIPGLGVGGNNSAVQAALTGMSKAQKKNVKRKEKRKEGEPESEDEEGGKAKVEEVVDDWDAEEEEGGEGGKGENEGKKEVVVVVAPPPPPPVVEDSKRVKALKKKLRQAELLQERSKLGLYIPPPERVKIDSIPDLEAELAKLELGDKEGEDEARKDKAA